MACPTFSSLVLVPVLVMCSCQCQCLCLRLCCQSLDIGKRLLMCTTPLYFQHDLVETYPTTCRHDAHQPIIDISINYSPRLIPHLLGTKYLYHIRNHPHRCSTSSSNGSAPSPCNLLATSSTSPQTLKRFLPTTLPASLSLTPCLNISATRSGKRLTSSRPLGVVGMPSKSVPIPT